jgi:hypothetical protein
MSLALFHEYQGSRHAVTAALSGNFTQNGLGNFAVLDGRSVSLFNMSDDSASDSLRYVEGVSSRIYFFQMSLKVHLTW